MLVVIGILIALSINNWNEKRKERVKEREILVDLVENLKINVNSLETNIKTLKSYDESSEIVLASLYDKRAYIDSMQVHFHQARIPKVEFFLSQTGYEGYKDVGLQIITNKDLKDEILNLFETKYPSILLNYKMENQSHFFKEGITRSMLTPAGPDHAQIGAASGILDYFDAIYEHHFNEEVNSVQRNKALVKLYREHENGLLDHLLAFLRTRSDIQIVGPDSTTNRLPIVSIIPLNKTIGEVYAKLTEYKLMLGTGDFYAVRPLMDMGIPLNPGVLRMSFVHYTSKEDITQLIAGLKNAL